MSKNATNPMVIPSVHTVWAETEKKQPRRRSIVREFCLNTSTHALPGIARSKSIHNRVFWSLSFTAFSAIMMYFIVNTVLNYFNYPTSFDLSYSSEWPQYFPAVSLCNVSPLRFDRIMDPLLNYTMQRNLTYAFPLEYLESFLIDLVNRNQSTVFLHFDLNDTLFTCTYSGYECSIQDFLPFLSPTYGLCHTFNAKLKDSRNRSLKYANPDSLRGTLDLSFYIHSHQYAPYMMDSAGIVILVHDNMQPPRIEVAGLELAPGKKHRLTYRKKITSFLSAPYTNCSDQISPLMKATLENYVGADYAYSQSICYQVCKQNYIYQQCGCVDPHLWSLRWVTVTDTDNVIFAPLCDTNNYCYRNATNTMINSSILLNDYCANCAPQCLIVNFLIQGSSSRTPLDWQMENIKAFVENTSIPLPANWSNTWREHIYDNYLAISIIRETDLVEYNTQKAVYFIMDVLSNIGGQTGLWIGISLLSIMEFIEMIYRLIRYQIHLVLSRFKRT